MVEENITEELACIRRAQNVFFMRLPERYSLDGINEEKLIDDKVRQSFTVFKSTLREIIEVVQAFFNLVMATELETKFNNMYVSELLRTRANFIRAGKEDQEDEIRGEAHKKTMESFHSIDEHDFIYAISKRLIALSETESELVAESNSAILRQSCVMLWSGVESLLREYFRLLINQNPSLSLKLFSMDESKRYWNSRDLSLELMESAGFDLKDCMGDLMLEINSMINLKSLKAGYSAISDNDKGLMKALKSKETHKLFTLRNLVAHRSGFIDDKFLAESSFSGNIGEKINITPSEFENIYKASKSIALALYAFHIGLQLSNKTLN